jgi:hypothetical protein
MVRSDNPVAGKIMDSPNPLVVRMEGANINRHIEDTVREAVIDQFETSRTGSAWSA